MSRQRIAGSFLCVLCVLCGDGVLRAAQDPHWLDRPLASWNMPGEAVPAAPPLREPMDVLRERCSVPAPRTAAEEALAASGWVPLEHLDRELVNGDVEIVAGMTGADAGCQPTSFNLFVFVKGRFAGTLSPSVMASRADGAAGPVRFVGDAITAEFSRYKAGDSACCPTARVSVRFRIDTTTGGAAVVPIDLKTTRSY